MQGSKQQETRTRKSNCPRFWWKERHSRWSANETANRMVSQGYWVVPFPCSACAGYHIGHDETSLPNEE